MSSFNHLYDQIIFLGSSAGEDHIKFLEPLLQSLRDRGTLEATLVVSTEDGIVPPQLQLLSALSIRSLSQIAPALSPDESASFVTNLVYHLQPSSVLNVSSRACWLGLARSGPALSRVSRLLCWYSEADLAHSWTSSEVDNARLAYPFVAKFYFESVAALDAFRALAERHQFWRGDQTAPVPGSSAHTSGEQNAVLDALDRLLVASTFPDH
jgi:hypothetical protein